MAFWLNLGVAGFGIDAVRHLVENDPDAWAADRGRGKRHAHPACRGSIGQFEIGS
jgi:glycosidase